jgi:hypothetical protein
MLHRHSGFMRDVDMWTLEEMDQDPSFRDLLRPRGFGWCGGFLVQVPSDDMLLFSVERRFVDGPIESSAVSQLNALRPHLARAAMMSARLRLERAQGMAESLTTMGLPSAVLLGNGKICATSSQFERIGPQIILGAFGRVALANPGANAQSIAERIVRGIAEHTDTLHPFKLLRDGRQRRRRRKRRHAAEEGDELAPLQLTELHPAFPRHGSPLKHSGLGWISHGLATMRNYDRVCRFRVGQKLTSGHE